MFTVLAKFTKIYKEYIPYLCPFESIIAYYMIDCIQSGTYHLIKIKDVYNIVHAYSASFVRGNDSHSNCGCNELFSESTPINNFNKYDHYEGLHYMTDKLAVFNTSHPNVNWLYNKFITYDGKNDDFSLFERRKQMIGYTDTHVYNMTLQPSLSRINYATFIIRSIIDTLLIMNSKSSEHVLLCNKQIVCCVITMEQNEVYEINITDIIKTQRSYLITHIYNIMIAYYGKYHDSYCKALKNKLDTEQNKTATEIIEACCSLSDKSPYMERAWRSIFDKIVDAGSKKKKRNMLYTILESDAKDIMDRTLKYTLATYFGIEDKDEDEDE
jgi:hypothetical protein